MHAGPDMQRDIFRDSETDTHLQRDSVTLHGHAEQYMEIMTQADIF